MMKKYVYNKSLVLPCTQRRKAHRLTMPAGVPESQLTRLKRKVMTLHLIVIHCILTRPPRQALKLQELREGSRDGNGAIGRVDIPPVMAVHTDPGADAPRQPQQAEVVSAQGVVAVPDARPAEPSFDDLVGRVGDELEEVLAMPGGVSASAVERETQELEAALASQQRATVDQTAMLREQLAAKLAERDSLRDLAALRKQVADGEAKGSYENARLQQLLANADEEMAELQSPASAGKSRSKSSKKDQPPPSPQHGSGSDVSSEEKQPMSKPRPRLRTHKDHQDYGGVVKAAQDKLAATRSEKRDKKKAVEEVWVESSEEAARAAVLEYFPSNSKFLLSRNEPTPRVARKRRHEPRNREEKLKFQDESAKGYECAEREAAWVERHAALQALLVYEEGNLEREQYTRQDGDVCFNLKNIELAPNGIEFEHMVRLRALDTDNSGEIGISEVSVQFFTKMNLLLSLFFAADHPRVASENAPTHQMGHAVLVGPLLVRFLRVVVVGGDTQSTVRSHHGRHGDQGSPCPNDPCPDNPCPTAWHCCTGLG